MRSLGVAKGKLGELKAAVDLLQSACAIFETEFGASHPQVNVDSVKFEPPQKREKTMSNLKCSSFLFNEQ